MCTDKTIKQEMLSWNVDKWVMRSVSRKKKAQGIVVQAIGILLKDKVLKLEN